ncbi:MAG: tetratricopeptide repeat protein, partial [Pedobacter sp.]
MSLCSLHIFSNQFYRKFIVLLLFLIALNLTLKAQNSTRQQKLDSLLRLDKVYLNEDTQKLDLYIKVLNETYNYTNDIALFQSYSDRSIRLAQKLKNGRSLAESYYYTGFNYQSRGVFDKAEDYYNLSLKKAKESNHLKSSAGTYLNLSALYNNLSNYSKALDANLAATQIFHKLGDQNSTAACYVNIASIYASLNQQKTAIDYLNKALKIFTELGNTPYAMGLTYSNLSRAYLNATNEDLKQLGVTDLERQNKVLNYVDRSQQVAIQQDIASLLSANYEIKGKISELFADKKSALDSYQKSLAQAK